MKPLRIASLAFWAGALACAPSPSISSVTPSSGDCEDPAGIRLRITGSALGPSVQVDLENGSTTQVHAYLGTAELTDLAVVGTGEILEGTLPGGALTRGRTYDLRVGTASGATVVLPQAFRCDGDEPPDGGDAGDAEDADDGAGDDDGGDAGDGDGGSPIGPVVSVSDAAVAGTVGSTASVAWVGDRWVVAWVEVGDPTSVLRLAEIPAGATEVSARHDVAAASLPTDPLVRARPGGAALAWVELGLHEYQYLALNAAIEPVGGAVPITIATDSAWRRDHDLAIGSTGLVAYVAASGDAAATATIRMAILDGDGTVGVAATAIEDGSGTPAEPRVAWSDEAFRVAWSETTSGASAVRVAVTDASAVVTTSPADLPAAAGQASAPALVMDDRTGSERLLACWETITDATTHGLVRAFLDSSFSAIGSVENVTTVGRAARCAVAPGLLAWVAWTTSPTVFLVYVAEDGTGTPPTLAGSRDVRTSAGLDIAAGPDGWGVVWIEHPVPSQPAGVRFVEVRAGP